MNSFFDFHFNYCSLVWMCHGRRNNTKINNLHERCLRPIHSDKKSSYEELHGKDGSVPIHHSNIRSLAIEMYKVKSGCAPKIFSNLFNQREISPCNLRRHTEFRVPLTRTVYHGSESISCLGPKIEMFSRHHLRRQLRWKLIKKWIPQAYSCKLCKNYIRLVLLKTYHKKCSFFNYWFSNIFTLMVKLISTFSSLLWYI